LGSIIGAGGFSWVVEGRRGKEKVAMKFSKIYNKQTNPHRYEHQRKSIDIEKHILGTVRHENIIRMHGFQKVNYTSTNGKSVPAYCMTMEACDRFDLFDYLFFSGSFQEKLAKTVCKQIIAAIECLHNLGLAHRDIKPQNIVFTEEFQVKLIDFGGARQVNEGGMMHTSFVGTRGYQAPELLLKCAYSKRCDVFSFGVLLFVILTASQPFKQALISDFWFRPLAKTPPDLSRFWRIHRKYADSVSSVGKDLLAQTMCYQPQGRFTIGEVARHEWFSLAPGTDASVDLGPALYREEMVGRRNRCVKQAPTVKDQLSTRTQKFEDMF